MPQKALFDRRAYKKSRLAIDNKRRRERYKEDVEYRQSRLRYNWAAYLKYRYGMTPEEYETKLRAQKRTCKICGFKTPRFPKAKQMLHLDHCHKTGKIRDFLCSKCNKALGCFNDCPELLEIAATYIRSHQ